MEQVLEKKMNGIDRALIRLVKSVTKSECYVKNGGDSYFFDADYSKMDKDPEILSALYEAIEGMVGKRLLELNDNPDKQCFFVRVKFGDTNAVIPEIQPMKESDISFNGFSYCKKLEECKALQVQEFRETNLIRFVGTGSFENVPCADGTSRRMFVFLNDCGSHLSYASIGSYIVKLRPECFKVVDKETFEKDYEPK